MNRSVAETVLRMQYDANDDTVESLLDGWSAEHPVRITDHETRVIVTHDSGEYEITDLSATAKPPRRQGRPSAMTVTAVVLAWLSITLIADFGICGLNDAMQPPFLIFGGIFLGLFFSPLLGKLNDN